MNLPEISVKRPTTTLMIFLGVILFGAVSLSRLDIDMFPKIDPPVISVLVFYPGASASDVETDVTEWVEDALSIVTNLDEITSLSKDNLSLVSCKFQYGTDMNEAANDIRDKLDFVKPKLPEDAEEPLLFKFSSATFPILAMGISASESYKQLYHIVDKKIADPLKRVPGVGAVDFRGGLERHIHVQFDKRRLEAYGLSVQRIQETLARGNLDLPGGNIEIGRRNYFLRIPGRFKNVEEIRDVVVDHQNGSHVYLKDVANVWDGFKEPIDSAWDHKNRAMVMFVQKQSGANTVNVIDRIKKRLEEIKKTLPGDVKIGIVSDLSEPILIMIGNLSRVVLVGGILVVLITFLLLRRLKGSLIIVLSIPFSLIASFTFFYLFGYTINMMSLVSLSVAIGMVVDNAIVVLDNIIRHVDAGEKPASASVDGTSEVGLAISASTLTTVVVFLPLLFVGGISGIIFKQLAVVVTIVLLASLFTALTMTPMLASKLLKSAEEEHAKNPFLRKIYGTSERIFLKVEGAYTNILSWALSNKKKVIFFASLIFISSLFMIPLVGTEFFPDADVGEISIRAHLHEGTRLEETDRVMEQILGIIREDVPELRAMMAFAGQSKEGIGTAIGFEEGSNIGGARIKLIKKTERKRSAKEVATQLRNKIHQIPGIERAVVNTVAIGQAVFFGRAGYPISIEILGHDISRTDALAGRIKKIVEETPGAMDPIISRKDPRPEIFIKVDREKASTLGLNISSIADTIRTNFYGKEATEYRDSGDDFDIFLRLREDNRGDFSDIGNITIASSNGGLIKLKNVAEVMEGFGPVEIERKERDRIVKVEADTLGRSLGEVVRDIGKGMEGLKIPPGIDVRFGGEAEEQRKAFRDLTLMLILGAILVYMVMASQFESLLSPFVIMFSVPFAFTGVIWALLLARTPLNIQSFIGLIMLVGIVVNNAIVLVDYINLLRSRGLSLYEAIKRAGANRLRPVMMTTLTTLFGALPMIYTRAEGSEFWNSMGIAFLGGLSVSTLITLVLVPTIYAVFHGKGSWVSF